MTDQFERQLWLAVAQRVFQLKQELDENLSKMIANAVGKMLGVK